MEEVLPWHLRGAIVTLFLHDMSIAFIFTAIYNLWKLNHSDLL